MRVDESDILLANLFPSGEFDWEIGAKLVLKCVNLTQNCLNLLVFLLDGLMDWGFHFAANLLHGQP